MLGGFVSSFLILLCRRYSLSGLHGLSQPQFSSSPSCLYFFFWDSSFKTKGPSKGSDCRFVCLCFEIWSPKTSLILWPFISDFSFFYTLFLMIESYIKSSRQTKSSICLIENYTKQIQSNRQLIVYVHDSKKENSIVVQYKRKKNVSMMVNKEIKNRDIVIAYSKCNNS